MVPIVREDVHQLVPVLRAMEVVNYPNKISYMLIIIALSDFQGNVLET